LILSFYQLETLYAAIATTVMNAVRCPHAAVLALALNGYVVVGVSPKTARLNRDVIKRQPPIHFQQHVAFAKAVYRFHLIELKALVTRFFLRRGAGRADHAHSQCAQ
jgi:hypothetical protein